jgi:7,8-dihydropterin-6-yl-methyl-4-(beta-D-ribofuranosyl)aminobenzene 5'-phosphate synthase
MRLTLIYDDEVCKEGLEAGHGFSCLVEVKDTPPILFDTGGNGPLLLSNMRKLDIDPHSPKVVFISHADWDHIDGLSSFLTANREVELYIPASCPVPSGAREVVIIKDPLEIRANIFSTGELRGIEQSLAIRTKKGVVVITGCSHPGVGNILKVASRWGKVYALIGGLHGFKEFELLKGLELICPCHCTRFKSQIKSLYPDKCIGGGAGRVIYLED